MNNMNETRGISVERTSPASYQTNIDVYSDIQITFSAELNTATLKNCIAVLKDRDGIYDGVQSLKKADRFDSVPGTLKYSERTVIFKPSMPFDIDTRYIVILNNTVKDITGLPLLKKHIFTFNTEITKSYPKCEITSPFYGSINGDIPEIHWKDQGAPSYIMHISKSPQFETLLYEQFIVPDEHNTYMSKDAPEDFQPEEVPPEELPYKAVKHVPDFNKKEGVYYIRVKAEGGKWSDTLQFFIKEVTDAVIAADDQDESIYLEDFLADIEEEIEILELFPPDGSTLNSLKTNIFYIKMKGMVSEERIEYPELEAYGEASDEKDEEYEHGKVQGTWTLVYDEHYDCTYLIFTPQPYDETDEKQAIAVLQGGAAAAVPGGDTNG